MQVMLWLVSVASLVGVVLNIRRHAACFVIWLATNTTWAIVDFTHGLHAQGALMCAYAALSLWGIVSWTRKHGAARS